MAGSASTDLERKMKPALIVRRLAEGQLTEAYAWYEERTPGLGGEFLRAFDAACAQI
jgi:hypothetical protein